MMDKKPEVLAPAGDRERLEAALRFGADAVYLGGKLFNMRAGTRSFTQEELAEAVKLTHQMGKRLYLTCNTLLNNEEADLLPRYLAEVHEMGVDAAIVSDIMGTNSVVSKGIFLKHYGEDFPYDEYKQEMAEVFFSRAAGGKLAKKPGVEELLGYLREHEFKVGLASSTREALVRKELSEGGLIEYFDQIIGGDKVKRSKPEPDIFLEACSRLGSEPEKCYVIEDSYNGIRAAHAAGMHPIMVPDLMEATEEMRGLAEVVLESLKDVRKYFDKIIVV